jgi:16S rRNA processing protein RimM
MGKERYMEELLQVGAITSTHGVRGEVKVFPTTDDPKRFKKLKQVLLDTGKEQLTLEITQVKFFKNLVILKFKDYDSMNDVEKWKGMPLYVTRAQAVKCEKDEYFIADLIGLSVVSQEGETLGELADVLQTGANDVYVVHREGKADLLLPAIKDCIKNIDIPARQMTVYVLPGLQD